MDSFKLAVLITFFYFLITALVHPWSLRFADQCVQSWIKGPLRPAWLFGLLHLCLRMIVFCFLLWMIIVLVLKFCGQEDPAQALGLVKAPRKGKVVMTIPLNAMGAGVIITEPYLYYQISPAGNNYLLSFKFMVYKGVKDKDIQVTGGRFVIKSLIGAAVIDQQTFDLKDQFNISSEDLTGVYVSPQPFQLRVKPQMTEMVWEMDRTDGKKIISKPIRLEPLLMGR